MAGNEERRRDAMGAEQLEDAWDANPRPVLAATEHGRRGVWVAKPDRHRVEVKRETDRIVRHQPFLLTHTLITSTPRTLSAASVAGGAAVSVISVCIAVTGAMRYSAT